MEKHILYFGFTGYIHDTTGTLAKPNKQWNTKSKVKRDAIQIVKNKIKELYEHGAPAKITHERSTKTITAVCNHWLIKKYIPSLRSTNSEQKNQKYIKNYKVTLNNITRHIGDVSIFDFNEDHFLELLQARRAEGAAKNTILKDSNMLKTVLRFSLKELGHSIVNRIKIRLKGDSRLFIQRVCVHFVLYHVCKHNGFFHYPKRFCPFSDQS